MIAIYRVRAWRRGKFRVCLADRLLLSCWLLLAGVSPYFAHLCEAIIELESLYFATRNVTRASRGSLWSVIGVWGDVGWRLIDLCDRTAPTCRPSRTSGWHLGW